MMSDGADIAALPPDGKGRLGSNTAWNFKFAALPAAFWSRRARRSRPNLARA